MIGSIVEINNASKLISVKEAAARLECSESGVWQWIHQGRLIRIKDGRAIRLREQEINAMVRFGVQPLGPTAGGVAIVRAKSSTATEGRA